MRKICVFLMTIALLAVLISCSRPGTGKNGENDTGDGGEHPAVSLESYGQYEKYIDEHSLSGEIVLYDSLKVIGGFKSFVVLSSAWENDFSQYMYTFDDGSGKDVNLTVKHSCCLENGTALDSGVFILSNMRSNRFKLSGCYIHDGIKYQYDSGKLSAICWSDAHGEYELTLAADISKYHHGYQTFTAGMLNCYTAQKTLEQLNNEIFDTSVLQTENEEVELSDEQLQKLTELREKASPRVGRFLYLEKLVTGEISEIESRLEL